jgi:hypothetical protein
MVPRCDTKIYLLGFSELEVLTDNFLNPSFIDNFLNPEARRVEGINVKANFYTLIACQRAKEPPSKPKTVQEEKWERWSTIRGLPTAADSGFHVLQLHSLIKIVFESILCSAGLWTF